MKSIQFKDKAAQKMYNDYMQQCKKSLKILSENDEKDCLLEINSYIYEFMDNDAAATEMQSLAVILNRLGKPKYMLKEIIASKKMAQAIKTFNPKYFIQALFLNLKKGTAYTVLSILILFLLCLPVLFVFKFIYPKNVGCFIGENSFSFGFINITNNTTEVLGNWFYPTNLLLIAFLYFSVILLLKSVKRKPLKYDFV